ncbi:MAG: heterodisulfide reductase-related iron-sulfur binding cluster [Aeromicrobium sp.]|uniref:heterodisulfide reductase-related iron-sulfur binding cluster n=1 Tax=Aeromicrobium sp. TaxID=1871063 RepID=UPI003C411C0C
MQVVAIVLSLLVTVVALPLLVVAVRTMVKVMRMGQPIVGRRDNPARRTVNMFIETFGHTRMFQRRWVGLMHWFVYLAFIILSTAVLQAYFQLFDAEFVWPLIGHFYPYEWTAEALGLLSTIGIVYLIAVRQRNHPRRLGRDSRFFGSTFWQAYFVEAMAMLEGAAILFVRGAEYRFIEATGGENGGRSHFPISSYLGDALYGSAGEEGLTNIIYFVALFKIVLAMVWLAVISRNLTMGIAWHRFIAWPNIWFKRRSDGGTALGGLLPIHIDGKPLTVESMEDLEEEDFEKLGVGKVEDFTWKGILDFSTCTECGRCQSQCPAWNTEKPLSPKLLVMGLRDHAYEKAALLEIPEDQRTEEQVKELERPLIGDEAAYGVIDPEVLWSCTNCGACVQQCPVDIEHVDHIEDMRRFQVLVESNFPSELNNIFKGLERKGNPWGMDPKTRMDWAKDLDFEVKQVGVDVESLDEVDWLFWVGCAGAFEDRAKKTTQAVAELLDTAGVSFAVLGDGETCTGDPARRAGNEIVFMQLAMENAEVFKETKVKKVVSTCAHCFNTLKNEYAEFGVELEVVHHTQLLNRLVREGKLKPVAPAEGAASKKITYHDPCFLGRHNQVYEPPRELLQVIPGAEFTEMPRNSETSFCCGAGGARMWMEENLGSRINVNRTEEAIATGADQIAVGCPFCRVMLSDGLALKQSEGEAREEVEVLDVAQMLLASIKRTDAPAQDDTATTDAALAGAATAKATEAEPDAEDKADPDSISATEDVGEAAEAHTEGEETSGDTPDDAEAAAAHDVEVDAKGAADPVTTEPEATTNTEPEATPEDTEEPADDRDASDKEEAAWANVGPVATDAASADDEVTDVPDESEPERVEAGADEDAVEATAEASAEGDVDDRDASDKEEAAWANVGPVATDAAEPSSGPEPGDTDDPETESVPEEFDDQPEVPATKDPDGAPAEEVTDVPDESEPVEQDAREEEAGAAGATAKIVAVEDAPTVEPAEDIAALSDANPSGGDLSDTATDIVPDDDTSPDDSKV